MSHSEAWTRLIEGGSFVLAVHQRPDGDALGSALALARVLRAMGKDVVVLSEDGVPENYRFIPETECVVTSTERRDFDIGMLIDCEGTKRVGTAAEVIQSAKTTGCLDHHLPDGEFGEIRIVDPEASSTSELLFEVLQANGLQVDQTAAMQLMTGIINDTGAFKFANTTSRTFAAASELTARGAQPSVIARLVYETRSLRAMQLLGRALASLEMDETGAVVSAAISKSDLDELSASDADTDSIVNLVGWVEGARAALLFREIKPGSVRVSLRSRDGVDVNRVARTFGGGGHAAAAGCTVEASLADARKLVTAEVIKWIAS